MTVGLPKAQKSRLRKILGLAFVVTLVSTNALRAEAIADCNQLRDQRLLMRACSDIIEGSGYSVKERAVAYRNRGNARADAGANAEALADFDQAIVLRPDDSGGFAGRARVHVALKNLDAAIVDYSEALRLVPGSVAPLAGRGHAYFIKGDVAAAVADFTEAIKLNPKSASTYNRRGLAYRKSGDMARAIDDLTAAITLNPLYALAYNNRGYVYEALGRKDEAITDFGSALLLDPSLVGARDGLRRLGVAESLLSATTARVTQGKALVEKSCAACHAVGVRGDSPNKKAPAFRNLHARHPSLALREPLSRGIAAPHDEMPQFSLTSAEIESIVAYINSLGTAESPRPTSKK